MTAPPPPAGWYSDPERVGGQRYWDGAHWGPQAPPPPPVAHPVTAAAPIKPAATIFGINLGTLIIGGAGVALVILVVVAVVAGHKPGAGWSEDRIESFVIESCQDWAKEDLKDPDSGKFAADWKAQPVTGSTQSPLKGYDPARGDKLYRVTGSLNAKNSFGGYVGNKPYVCNVYFNPSDETANGKAFGLG